MSALLDALSGSTWGPVLVDSAVRGVVVLALAGAVTLAMRRSSAAARHLVWFLGMLSLLALPILSAGLPGWHILPRWRLFDPVAQGPAAPTPQTPAAPAPAAPTDPAPIAPPSSSISAGQTNFGRVERVGPGDQPPQLAVATPPAPTPAPTPAPAATPDATSAPPPAPGSATSDSASPPAPPAHPATSLATWLLLTWLAGTFLLLLRIAFASLSLRWLQHRCGRVIDPAWLELLDEVCRQLGISPRRIRLISGRPGAMPMTWGVWRTYVLLTGDADAWPPEQRRAVLLHELAHARRGDCLTQWVAQLACALYWINPLAWLAWRRMQAERERACDDLVLGTGAKASAYAEQLLHIASEMPATKFSAAAIAMARPSKLEGRLLAILDAGRNRKALTRIGAMVAVLVVFCVVVPLAILRCRPVRGDEPNAHDDWRRMQQTVGTVLEQWRQSLPKDQAALRQYDTELVINPADRTVALTSAGGTLAQAELPGAYRWTCYRIAEDGPQRIDGTLRLKVRNHLGQQNVCAELFYITGVAGPKAGLTIEIAPLGLYVALHDSRLDLPAAPALGFFDYVHAEGDVNESMMVRDGLPAAPTPLWSFPKINDRVWCVRIAPDAGSLLATDREVVHQVDIRTGREIRGLRGDGFYYAAAFSAGGEQIIGLRQLRQTFFVDRWDAATGRPIGQVETDLKMSVVAALSGDGRYAAVAQEGWITLWDVVKGQRGRDLKASGATLRYFPLAFSPDGRHVAGLIEPGSNRASTIVAFDVESGAEIFRTPIPLVPNDLAFSADGKLLFAPAPFEPTQVIDCQAGKVIGTLKTVRGAVWPLATLPGGGGFVSGERSLRLWRPDGRIMASCPAFPGMCTLAVTPDGALAVAGGGKNLRCYAIDAPPGNATTQPATQPAEERWIPVRGELPEYQKLSGPEMVLIGTVSTDADTCRIVVEQPWLPVGDLRDNQAAFDELRGQRSLQQVSHLPVLIKAKLRPVPSENNRPELVVGSMRELAPGEPDWQMPWPVNFPLLPPEVNPFPISTIATCEAVSPADSRLGFSGVQSARQQFKVLDVFHGDVKVGQQIDLKYSYLVPGMGFGWSGRDIRQGERFIWVFTSGEQGLSGYGAIADTPHNRKLAAELAGRLNGAASTQPAATQPSTRTISYRTTFTQGDLWTRVAHPAQAWVGKLKGNRARVESPNGEVAIHDGSQGKMLFIDTRAKTATLSTVEDPAAAADPMLSVDKFLEMADPGPQPVTSLGQMEIGGRKVEGVRFAVDGQMRSVWRDATTHQPVQIETVVAPDPKLRSGQPLHIVYTDIIIDVPMDESLFSLKPPPGYVVQEAKPAEERSMPATAPATQPAPTRATLQVTRDGEVRTAGGKPTRLGTVRIDSREHEIATDSQQFDLEPGEHVVRLWYAAKEPPGRMELGLLYPQAELRFRAEPGQAYRVVGKTAGVGSAAQTTVEIVDSTGKVVSRFPELPLPAATLPAEPDGNLLPMAAAVLDFRIAAQVGEGDKPAGNIIPADLAARYIRDCEQNGPKAQVADGFAWFEAADARLDPCITATHQGRRYILLMTADPYTMLAGPPGRHAWGLKDVWLDRDLQGNVTVAFKFDAPGAQRFGRLTESNLRRPLAILVNNKVLSAPIIRSKIVDSGIITGVNRDAAQQLVNDLRLGMPSVQPETQPAATQPARSPPDEIKVELLGVAEWPSEKLSFWGPNGQPVNLNVPADLLPGAAWKPDFYNLGDHPFARLMVFRSDRPILHFSPQFFASGTAYRTALIAGGQLIGVATGFDGEQREAAMRFGVPAEEWRTIAEVSAQKAVIRLVEGRQISFGKVLEGRPKGAEVSVRHGFNNMQTRLVAVDSVGKEFISDSVAETGPDGERVHQYLFSDLAPTDVESIRLQVCRYSWAEVKHIPLQPATTRPATQPAASLEAKQTDFAPAPHVFYALEPNTTYHTDAAGPASYVLSRAWNQANEFVNRTNLRNNYRLPAGDVGPREGGFVVRFDPLDAAGAPLQVFVTADYKLVKVIGPAAATQPAPAPAAVPAAPTPSSPAQPNDTTRPLSAPLALWQNIAQRTDPELRFTALDEALAKLGQGAGAKRYSLQALLRCSDVPFDRKPFLKPLRGLLADEDIEVRALAAGVLGMMGDESDIPAITKLADDPESRVRGAVVPALVQLEQRLREAAAERAAAWGAAIKVPTEPVDAVIERLLDDPSQEVRRSVARSLWSRPVTKAAELKLLKLADDPQIGYDVMYYFLTTRPLVRPPVARKLIELMEDPRSPDKSGRAAWGLAHPVADDARDLVRDALIRNFDATLDPYIRQQCIAGLGQIADEKAIAKLKQIAEGEESAKIREQATEALRMKPPATAPAASQPAAGGSRWYPSPAGLESRMESEIWNGGQSIRFTVFVRNPTAKEIGVGGFLFDATVTLDGAAFVFVPRPMMNPAFVAAHAEVFKPGEEREFGTWYYPIAEGFTGLRLEGRTAAGEWFKPNLKPGPHTATFELGPIQTGSVRFDLPATAPAATEPAPPSTSQPTAAIPQRIQEALAPLNLTPEQQGRLSAWLKTQKDPASPNPAELARFLMSIATKEQKAALIKLFESGGTPGPQPAPAPALAPATNPARSAPPYTDDEAKQFVSRLSEIRYPTTEKEACRILGIDAPRLYTNGLMLAGTSGQTSTSFAQLSPGYRIAFHSSIRDSSLIRVDIYPAQGPLDTNTVTLADGEIIQVRFDLDKLARLGFTAEQLAQRDWPAMLKARKSDELSGVLVDFGNGQKVRLLDVATIVPVAASAGMPETGPAAATQPARPLPRSYIPVRELVANGAGVLVAELVSVGEPEPGPPGCADYSSRWKVIQVLRGKYAGEEEMSFRVQSLPKDRQERIPELGKRYILVTTESNDHQVAWIFDNDERKLDEIRALLPSAKPATQPAARIPSYTDEQAERFAAKLPMLQYPCTIDSAWEFLGIDPGKLHGLMKVVVIGQVSTASAHLSPGYDIGFARRLPDQQVIQVLITRIAPATQPAWHEVLRDDWIAAEVEPRLYEAPDSPHFFIHVRVVNTSNRVLGIDLSRRESAIYPNQWGMLPTKQRMIINEERIVHKPLEPAAEAALLADFQKSKLAPLPPGQAVDYWSEFNASGRKDVEKQADKFMYISLDGELRLTDGKSVHQRTLEWGSQANTDLIIRSPIPWAAIPGGALLTGR